MSEIRSNLNLSFFRQLFKCGTTALCQDSTILPRQNVIGVQTTINSETEMKCLALTWPQGYLPTVYHDMLACAFLACNTVKFHISLRTLSATFAGMLVSSHAPPKWNKHANVIEQKVRLGCKLFCVHCHDASHTWCRSWCHGLSLVLHGRDTFADLFKPALSVGKWAQSFKYVVNVPGNCGSARLAYQLYDSAVVLLVVSEDEEWYDTSFTSSQTAYLPYALYLPYMFSRCGDYLMIEYSSSWTCVSDRPTVFFTILSTHAGCYFQHLFCEWLDLHKNRD